jgi:hypothetical protein
MNLDAITTLMGELSTDTKSLAHIEAAIERAEITKVAAKTLTDLLRNEKKLKESRSKYELELTIVRTRFV